VWVKQFGKRTCKPNSVVCGHSSRRRVAADTHQRPTRRFRQLSTPSTRPVAEDRSEPPGRIGQMRNAAWLLAALPSLFGLAPCGVYPAPGVTAGAVRSCRTISPLPRRESWPDGRTLPRIPEARSPLRRAERGVAEAVSFLWHWPSMGFEAHVPDVIRHTALRSSDFPPPADLRLREAAGSDRPVLLPGFSLPRMETERAGISPEYANPGHGDQWQVDQVQPHPPSLRYEK